MIQRVVTYLHVNERPVRPSFRRAEDGQGIVEYAMITGLIGVAVLVVASVGGFGTALISMYNSFPGPF